MGDCFRITQGALHVDIRASPGASKTCFAGLHDGRLRVRIAAAPEDGRANAELCGFLAKALGCAKREPRLVSGEKSRLKTVALPPRCLAALEALVREQAAADTNGNSGHQNTQIPPA